MIAPTARLQRTVWETRVHLCSQLPFCGFQLACPLTATRNFSSINCCSLKTFCFFRPFPMKEREENVSWNPNNQRSKSVKCSFSASWNYLCNKSVTTCVLMHYVAAQSYSNSAWKHIFSYIHNTIHPRSESQRRSKRKLNWKCQCLLISYIAQM